MKWVQICICLTLFLSIAIIPAAAFAVLEGEIPATVEMGESAQTAIGAAKGKTELPPVIPPPSFAKNKHLRDDCNAGRAKGCHGGNDIYLKLGLTFDTRDFEPDPHKGLILTAMNELSPKFLGSAFNYGRLTTAVSSRPVCSLKAMWEDIRVW